jgi:hypothetical protein
MANSSNKPLQSSDGIWAKVNLAVVIRSYEHEMDRVDSVVTIRATNHTQQDIRLSEPYRLPVRKVFQARAYIGEYSEKSDTLQILLTQKLDEEIIVYFASSVLKAGETFTWTVTYSRMAELYLAHILAYDIFIDPQSTFQGVDVKKHEFSFSVTLAVPKNAKWTHFRHWNLHQQNPLKVNPTVTHGREKTTCVYTNFELAKDEAFDMRLAGVYEFKSWIGRAFHIAVGAASVTLLEHGPALILKLVEVFAKGAH